MQVILNVLRVNKNLFFLNLEEYFKILYVTKIILLFLKTQKVTYCSLLPPKNDPNTLHFSFTDDQIVLREEFFCLLTF